MPPSHSLPSQPAQAGPVPMPKRTDILDLPKPGDARFSPDRLRALQANALDPREKARMLRERDQAGLSMAQWTLAEAAASTAETAAMVRALAEPTPEETGRLDALMGLLEAIAETVQRIEQRLATLESRVAGRP